MTQRPGERQEHHQRDVVVTTKALFYNVCILCGTAVVVALTIKVILTIF